MTAVICYLLAKDSQICISEKTSVLSIALWLHTTKVASQCDQSSRRNNEYNMAAIKNGNRRNTELCLVMACMPRNYFKLDLRYAVDVRCLVCVVDACQVSSVRLAIADSIGWRNPHFIRFVTVVEPRLISVSASRIWKERYACDLMSKVKCQVNGHLLVSFGQWTTVFRGKFRPTVRGISFDSAVHSNKNNHISRLLFATILQDLFAQTCPWVHFSWPDPTHRDPDPIPSADPEKTYPTRPNPTQHCCDWGIQGICERLRFKTKN